MDDFEELKRSILSILANNEIPVEVIKKIDKIQQKLMGIYDSFNANNSGIQEYTRSNFNILKFRVNTINNIRKDEQLQELTAILRAAQNKLEENQNMQEDEKKKFDEQNKDQISQMDMHNKKMVNYLISEIQNCIQSVKSMANRSLDVRQTDMRKIEDINYEVRNLMSRMEVQDVEEFEQILQSDDKNLVRRLINRYEQYQEHEARKNKTKRQQFVEGLDANISLEDQKNTSDELIRKSKDEKEKNIKDLPSDLIK